MINAGGSANRYETYGMFLKSTAKNWIIEMCPTKKKTPPKAVAIIEGINRTISPSH